MMAGHGELLYSRRMTDAADDPVLGALARAIVERFAPERIVLFGSRARGDHHTDSDYDVMVVSILLRIPPMRSASRDSLRRHERGRHRRHLRAIRAVPDRRRHAGIRGGSRGTTFVYTGVISVRDARVVRETPDTPPETPQSGADRCRRPAAASPRFTELLTAAPTAAVPRRPFAARALDLIG